MVKRITRGTGIAVRGIIIDSLAEIVIQLDRTALQDYSDRAGFSSAQTIRPNKAPRNLGAPHWVCFTLSLESTS